MIFSKGVSNFLLDQWHYHKTLKTKWKRRKRHLEWWPPDTCRWRPRRGQWRPQTGYVFACFLNFILILSVMTDMTDITDIFTRNKMVYSLTWWIYNYNDFSSNICIEYHTDLVHNIPLQPCHASIWQWMCFANQLTLKSKHNLRLGKYTFPTASQHILIYVNKMNK